MTTGADERRHHLPLAQSLFAPSHASTMAAVSGAQGSACVYHRRIEGRGWHNMVRCSVLCRYVLDALTHLSEKFTPCRRGAKGTTPLVGPSQGNLCQVPHMQKLSPWPGTLVSLVSKPYFFTFQQSLDDHHVHLASTLYYMHDSKGLVLKPSQSGTNVKLTMLFTTSRHAPLSST
jgi:hypothetical protein